MADKTADEATAMDMVGVADKSEAKSMTYPSIAKSLDKPADIKPVDKRELLLVLIVSSLIFLLFAFNGLREFHLFYDEGYTMTVSDNIMHGLVPYRDFDLIYTPLTFYLNVLFMAVSNTIITPRLLMIFYGLLGVAGVYILSARLIPGRARLIPPIMYSLYIIPIFTVPMPSVLANALLIFAAIAYLDRKTVLSGILLGLCFLTKQNIGIFGAMAFLAFIIFSHKPRYWPKKALEIAIPGVAIIIPYLIYLIISKSLWGFIADIFLYPLIYKDAIQAVSLTLPFTKFIASPMGIARCLSRILYLLPIPIYIITFILAVTGASSKSAKEKRLLMLITLISAFNYLQFFPNKDITHFAWGFAPSFIILGYWLQSKQKLIVAAASAALLGYLLISAYGVQFYGTSPFINTAKVNIPKMGFMAVTASNANLIYEIHQRVGNSTIYVFNGDYSLFYYLTNNIIPSRVLQHSGGRYATPELEQTIIAELRAAKPELVITRDGPVYPGYSRVWEYINSTYHYESAINASDSALLIYRRST